MKIDFVDFLQIQAAFCETNYTMFSLSLSLSLLFPIILYSTYGVLQCNEFGGKTKETLTGFYK